MAVLMAEKTEIVVEYYYQPATHNVGVLLHNMQHTKWFYSIFQMETAMVLPPPPPPPPPPHRCLYGATTPTTTAASIPKRGTYIAR